MSFASVSRIWNQGPQYSYSYRITHGSFILISWGGRCWRHGRPGGGGDPASLLCGRCGGGGSASEPRGSRSGGKQILTGRLGLLPHAEKFSKPVMSPGDFISALYRRGGTLLLVARRPLRGREGQSGLQNPCADEDGQWRRGVSTDGQSTKLPYRVVGEIKIPGVMSDTSLGFVMHIAEVLRRTSMRHGVMARLPRITWGL